MPKDKKAAKQQQKEIMNKYYYWCQMVRQNDRTKPNFVAQDKYLGYQVLADKLLNEVVSTVNQEEEELEKTTRDEAYKLMTSYAKKGPLGRWIHRVGTTDDQFERFEKFNKQAEELYKKEQTEVEKRKAVIEQIWQDTTVLKSISDFEDAKELRKNLCTALGKELDSPIKKSDDPDVTIARENRLMKKFVNISPVKQWNVSEATINKLSEIHTELMDEKNQSTTGRFVQEFNQMAALHENFFFGKKAKNDKSYDVAAYEVKEQMKKLFAEHLMQDGMIDELDMEQRGEMFVKIFKEQEKISKQKDRPTSALKFQNCKELVKQAAQEAMSEWPSSNEETRQQALKKNDVIIMTKEQIDALKLEDINKIMKQRRKMPAILTREEYEAKKQALLKKPEYTRQRPSKSKLDTIIAEEKINIKDTFCQKAYDLLTEKYGIDISEKNQKEFNKDFRKVFKNKNVADMGANDFAKAKTELEKSKQKMQKTSKQSATQILKSKKIESKQTEYKTEKYQPQKTEMDSVREAILSQMSGDDEEVKVKSAVPKQKIENAKPVQIKKEQSMEKETQTDFKQVKIEKTNKIPQPQKIEEAKPSNSSSSNKSKKIVQIEMIKNEEPSEIQDKPLEKVQIINEPEVVETKVEKQEVVLDQPQMKPEEIKQEIASAKVESQSDKLSNSFMGILKKHAKIESQDSDKSKQTPIILESQRLSDSTDQLKEFENQLKQDKQESEIKEIVKVEELKPQVAIEKPIKKPKITKAEVDEMSKKLDESTKQRNGLQKK